MKKSLKRKPVLPDLVCDTSSIQYLHQVGLLYILHELGQDIFIPPAVKHELAVGLEHGVDLPDLERTDWIKMICPQGGKSTRLLTDMGPGEAEVMLLALENDGLVAVLDDSLARTRAHILNIPFNGTLGLLLDAKKIGLIRSVGPVLDTLIALQFRLATHTREMILRKAGELSEGESFEPETKNFCP
jgi:hypothetical protein